MRQKTYHYLSRVALAAVFLLVCLSANGQDLIERTLKNVTLPATEPIKPIGKQIHSYRWPKSGISLFELHKSKKSNAYSEYTDEAVYLTIDQKKLSRSFKSNEDLIRFSVPVSASESFDLILESVEILAPDYKMETSDGRVIYPDRSKFKFYRGIIADDPNSIATVTIIGDKVRALISDDHGNYILGELPKEKGIFTLYNDKTLKKNLGEFCQVSDSDLPASIVQDQKKVSTDKSTVSPCVPIYVEADYAMYQDHGNSESNVEAFIASLLNEVAAVYANNTGNGGSSSSITISLSSTLILTSAAQDPYDQISGVQAILNKFGEVRQNSPDGRLKHLISTRDIGGGVAWLDVLCLDYFTFLADFTDDGINNPTTQHAGPFAVSGDMGTSISIYPMYSWEVQIFSHEMGHNFGSPHTHSCSWPGGPIDDCYYVEGGNCSLGPTPPASGGTIMSYCHICEFDPQFCNQFCNGAVPNCPNPGISLSAGFGPLPGQLIYDSYSGASCTLECENTTILGCTDPDAYNYDSNATEDDGSCQTCSDELMNGDELATDCGGSYPGCRSCIYGCSTDPNAHNYVANPDIEESCETCIDGVLNGDEVAVDCGGSKCASCVTGCTDPTACDFDPDADISGSCDYTSCAGCTEVFASNYDNTATRDDGSCVYDCTTNTTNTIDGTNVNASIITSQSSLQTMGTVIADPSNPIIWRANGSVELNPNFSIEINSSVTIDVGECEDN